MEEAQDEKSGPMARSSVVGQQHSNLQPPNAVASNPAVPMQAENEVLPARPKRYWSKKSERWWIAACFMAIFMAGWNDSQTGPLLLRIQSNYHLTYTIVSLIFVFAFLGFLTACLCNVWLTDRLGFGTVVVMGASCQVVAYSIQAATPPYPVFCLSFFISGMGMGIQDAQTNTLIATLDLVDGKTIRMSCLHAVYGVGALCAPLVATQFAQMRRWNFHYFTSLGIAVANVAVLSLVFRFRTEESLLCHDQAEAEAKAEAAQSDEPRRIPEVEKRETENAADSDMPVTATIESEAVSPKDPHSSGAKLRSILLSPLVQLLAFYCLMYVSAEITIGSWIVPYVQTTLDAPPSSGMIASGYFAGLTLGRLILIPVNGWIGERNAVYVYSILAVALEVVIWQVPSIIGTGVAVSFVGVFLGPIYILIMHACTHALPKHLYGGAIGYIASLGQGGSAIFPFLTGALSEKHGVWVLQPLIVAILLAALLLWAGAMWVSRPKRKDK